MSYSFPDALLPLREYLDRRGCDVHAFASARQAAFMAQQLLGSRIKFPPQGADMLPTLMAIQGAIGDRSPNTNRITPGPVKNSPRQVIAKQASKAGRKLAGKGAKSKKKPEYLTAFSPAACRAGCHIFADGAAIPNPGAGGWGFVVYRDGEEIYFECGGELNTTNNRMEVGAALMAISWASNIIDGPVTIWCDSQYVVNGVNDWRHGWKAKGWQRGGPKAKPADRHLANADLWIDIDAALSDPSAANISVCWVKGHAGHVGNERADELAEIGRRGVARTARRSGADLAPAPLASGSPVEQEPSVDDLDAEYRAIMAG